MLNILPLILLALGSSVHGQELTGKPCVIEENLKGTCFYDANGEISYWIVRVWKSAVVGGGPETALDEFVGYPGARKAQQEYNRRIKEDQASGFYFDAPLKVTFRDTSRESISEQMQRVTDGIGADGRYRMSTDQPLVTVSAPIRGWDATLNRIYAPASIQEWGNLNPDTLRIPFYLAGAHLLAAERRLLEDCRAASSSYRQADWADRTTPYSDRDFWPEQALREGLGVCVFGISKNARFSGLQRALKERKAQLDAAHAVSRRVDDTVRSLGSDSNFRIVRVEDLPAGFSDRLVLLQAGMDEALQGAEAMETISAKRQKEFDAALETERATKAAKLAEEVNKAMDERYPHARD